MPTCKLCQTAEANQTGSHLLSAFMVTTMIGQRGQEVGHLLSRRDALGHRENSRATPIMQDYILCIGCEMRLSFLESYISAELTRKIDEGRYQENFPVTARVGLVPFKTALRVSPRAFALMIYSVMWRLSISDESMFRGFRLAPPIEEDFRSVLNTLLPPYQDFKVSAKPKDWTRALAESDRFRCYPTVVMKCEHSPTRDTSRNMVFVHEAFDRPYQMLANEFLVLLSAETFTLSQDLFELQRQFNSVDHLANDCSSLKIGILPEARWNDVLTIPRNAFVRQQLAVIRAKLASDFSVQNNRPPTEMELAQLTAAYIRTHWPDEEQEGD